MDDASPKTRHCNKCDSTKELDSFPRKKATKRDGRGSICKACNSIRSIKDYPKNKEKFSHLLSRLVELIFTVTLTAVVCGVLLSYSIVNFIGGTEFLPSGLPLQILFIATGIIFLATLFGNSVVALDLQKKAPPFFHSGKIPHKEKINIHLFHLTQKTR